MKRSLLLVAVILAYLVTAEFNARKKSEDFCNSVGNGQETADLADRATAAGAKAALWEGGAEATRTLTATFTGFYPIFRFTCRIEEKNATVVAKQTSVTAPALR